MATFTEFEESLEQVEEVILWHFHQDNPEGVIYLVGALEVHQVESANVDDASEEALHGVVVRLEELDACCELEAFAGIEQQLDLKRLTL